MAQPIAGNFDLIFFVIASIATYFLMNVIYRSKLIRRLTLSLLIINFTTLLAIIFFENQIELISSRSLSTSLILIQGGVVLILTFLSKSRVTDPLRSVIQRTNRMAEGDLVTEIDFRNQGVGEAKSILESTSVLADRFRAIIVNIKTSTDQLSQASEELASGSEEVAATTEEVTGTIQTIAEGASEQVRRLDEVSRILNDMVNLTEESIRQIGVTSKITLDIAEQTNLVSLNAAIEAAKASSEAEGFQVVADHVRQLSIESKAASNRVNQITHEISIRMRESVERIVSAVETIASVAENTAASSEEAAAAAEEQSAALQEITLQAQKMAELSETTEKNIQEFKVY